jgi:DNA-binding CsgD family transcriptional regulator
VGRVPRAASAVAEVAVAALSAPVEVSSVLVTLDRLRSVIGADAAGFYLHERGGSSIAVHLSPDDLWHRVPFVRAPTRLVAGLHPGIRHLLRPSTLQPFTVTDLMPHRAWLSTEIGTLMRPDWGDNYQLAIPVPAARYGAAVWVWVLGRVSSDFSDSDREVATAVQPVLAVVTRHHAAGSSIPVCGPLTTLLTQRELTVLALFADGLTSTGAAGRLGTTPRTVDKHAERIYRKLGVHDRATAVMAAKRLGLGNAVEAASATSATALHA